MDVQEAKKILKDNTDLAKEMADFSKWLKNPDLDIAQIRAKEKRNQFGKRLKEVRQAVSVLGDGARDFVRKALTEI